MYSWRKERKVYLLSRIFKIRPRLLHSRACLYIIGDVGSLCLPNRIVLLAWGWCALGRSVRSEWDRQFCAKLSGRRHEVATIQFVIWNCYFSCGSCGLYVIAPWEESKWDSGIYACNGWNHASHCRVPFFFLYKEVRRYEEGKYVILFISEMVGNFFYFECWPLRPLPQNTTRHGWFPGGLPLLYILWNTTVRICMSVAEISRTSSVVLYIYWKEIED